MPVLERLNELAHIRYPFVEDAQMLDNTRAVTLSSGVLLDMQAVIYTRGAGTLRLQGLDVSADSSWLTAIFVYEPLAGATLLLPVLAPSSAAAWAALDYYRAEVITPDIALFPVFGKGVVDFAAASPGMSLAWAGLDIEPACICIRNNHAVSAMASSTGVMLTGNVKIHAGYNMVVAVLAPSNTMRFNAMVGEGEGMPCTPILETGNCADLVYSINGMTPDWNGDLVLQGGPGISVTGDPANNAVVISTPYKACNPGCSN